MSMDILEYKLSNRPSYRPSDRDSFMQAMLSLPETEIYYIDKNDLPKLKNKLNKADYEYLKQRIAKSNDNGIYLNPWY